MSPEMLEHKEFNGGIHMRRTLTLFSTLIFAMAAFSGFAKADSPTQPKDWTFLVYLNGNNNLDSFGAMNINQMEKVGSTAKVNVIVQWASLETRTVKRLLIKKDNDPKKVTSPVIQDLGSVDMGDWHSLVDFVKWGAEKYPAKQYFVDVWNHGSGWHAKQGAGGILKPMDISWDDLSGNHMTTKQLALALTESSKIIGHKVDLYGSDACLMAMVEVANEMKDSVNVFAGSQETEPGAGWPYDAFLTHWNALPNASPQEVAKALSAEYAKSYQGTSDKVTFSAFDLNFLDPLTQSIREFSNSFSSLNASAISQVLKAAQASQNFTNSDYVDFVDFLKNVKSANVSALSSDKLTKMGDAAKNFIIASNNVGFPNAHGMSIWIPTEKYQYSEYSDLYSQMAFEQTTHWGDVLKTLLK